MKRFLPFLITLSAFAFAAGLGWTGWNLLAQEEDPFAAKPEKDPAAPPKKDEKKKGKDKGKKEDPNQPPPKVYVDTPAVVAVRESNPTTPEQLVRAADTMLGLGRPDEASKYLAAILAAKPDLNTLADLQRKMGSGIFFRFAREPEVQPVGRQVSEAVLIAADRYAKDPGRLQAMVQKLVAGDPAIRDRAIDELRGAGEAAVSPIIAAMAQKQSGDGYALLREALVQLGPVAVEPALGVAFTADDDLRSRILPAIARMQSRRVLPTLLGAYVSAAPNSPLHQAAMKSLEIYLGAIPTPKEARDVLLGHAKAYYAGQLPLRAGLDDLVTLYRWNSQAKVVVTDRVLAEDAAQIVAAHLAAELYQSDSKNIEFRRLALLSTLEAAKIGGGLDQPLQLDAGKAIEFSKQAGPAAVEEVLELAMRTGRIPAAISACEVLAQIGSADLIRSETGAVRPLVAAMAQHDRRLRFAAAVAVARLAPQEAYPGSSQLSETLGYLAGTGGVRRAVVGHPVAERKQSYVGMLMEMGYEASGGLTGREVMLQATDSADVEVVVIADSIDQPRMTELFQQLRQDKRTARLPIVILAREEQLFAMSEIARVDRMAFAFPYPSETKGMSYVVQNVLRRAGREAITPEERVIEATMSLDILAELAANPKTANLYDLQRQVPALDRALQSMEIAPQAARVLGLIGTPAAQRALVTFASQPARPISHRQAAAKAFELAVKRRRVLLSTQEIEVQYERYNQSKESDEATQLVLAQILDSIESRAPQETPAGAPKSPKAEGAAGETVVPEPAAP